MLVSPSSSPWGEYGGVGWAAWPVLLGVVLVVRRPPGLAESGGRHVVGARDASGSPRWSVGAVFDSGWSTLYRGGFDRTMPPLLPGGRAGGAGRDLPGLVRRRVGVDPRSDPAPRPSRSRAGERRGASPDALPQRRVGYLRGRVARHGRLVDVHQRAGAAAVGAIHDPQQRASEAPWTGVRVGGDATISRGQSVPGRWPGSRGERQVRRGPPRDRSRASTGSKH